MGLLIFGSLAVGHPMARCRALVVRDRASGHLVDPGAEALLVAKPGEAPLHPQEDVLDDIIDVDLGAHAARDERSQPGVQVTPRSACSRIDHAEVSGAQHAGPQQALPPPGFTASMVADAT